MSILLYLALSTVAGNSYIQKPENVVVPAIGQVLDVSEGFPIWLQDSWKRTDQTSGISFFRHAGDAGSGQFILADDIGKLWLARLTGSHQISLNLLVSEIPPPEVRSRKFDLEALEVDLADGSIYAASEGNPSRLWRVKLTDVEGKIGQAHFTELTLPGVGEVLSRVESLNKGLEALAVNSGRFYLGTEGGAVNRAAWIIIADRDTGIVALHNVSELFDVRSLTGAVATPTGALFLDRNRDEVIRIDFNATGQITGFRRAQMRYKGPGGVRFSLHSAEGITMDTQGNLWVVIDPWKYFPATWDNLSELDKDNYRAAHRCS